MSTRAVAPMVAAPVAVLTPLQRPMLQRTCGCGEHTDGGECDDCKKKKKMPLQRHANGWAPSAFAPPIVHDVLRSPGRALDESTKTYFGSRLGGNFSQVRVHTDERAAESARAVSALAYTVGNHVVFGAGRYSPANSSGRRLLAHELTHVVQQQHEGVASPQYRLEIGPPQDRFEREADLMADRIASGMEASQEEDSNLSPTQQLPTHLSPTHVAPRVQRAEASASAVPAPSRAAATLLVEDDTRDRQPGQMRKGEFLDKLQVSVCATADEELSSVGRSAQGCPYIERWIGHLRTKGSQFVERGIRKYAPDSAGVTKAEDYIPFVAARVRRGVARWAKTGEITEVPDELKGQLLAANAADAVDRLFSGVGGVLGVVGSAVVGGVKAVAGLFAKEREGGVRDAGDPQEIQAQLRSGDPLDAGIKSRMEMAFGGDFSHVRVHTDFSAAELSARLNARAFTVGSDVAFGAGEYQPGTLIGDALIAHELAHVMQQGDGGAAAAPQTKRGGEYNALEEDADVSAAGAVASLWGGTKGALLKIGKNAAPSLRSGLRLQRCGASSKATRTGSPSTSGPAAPTPGATCPTRTVVDRILNETPGGLAKGYRTAYGIAAVMAVEPDSTTWNGASIYEHVSPGSSSCPTTWNLCEGGRRPFVVGDGRYSTILGNLPPARNRFYDFHVSRWGHGSRLHDPSQNPTGMDSCQVVCNQEYSCNGTAIGRHTITRNFRKGSYGGRDVTIVETTKT